AGPRLDPRPVDEGLHLAERCRHAPRRYPNLPRCDMPADGGRISHRARCCRCWPGVWLTSRMARPFRFSAQATGPLHDLSWINTTAVRMEQRRFAALFSFDHIGAVDPFAPLLAAGIAAGGIEVGPLVL